MAMMPRPTAPIAGPGGLPTREWLDYLRGLAGAGDLSGITRAIAELQRQVAALEQSGASGEVLGMGAIQSIGSLADGLVRLNLRELEDAGGGELLKIVRDAYGRVAGTSAATTDDLGEGAANLYFTDARAAAAAPVKSVNGQTGHVVVSGGGGGPTYGRGNELGSLVHLTGPNNSTAFPDKTGKIWTPYGGAKISDGQLLFGTPCAYFDGVDDYISTPNHAAFDLRRGPLTVEFSIFPTKPNDGVNSQYLLRYGGTVDYWSGWVISLRQPNNVLYIQRGTGTGEVVLSTGIVIPQGQWTHVAICYLGPMRGIVAAVNGIEVGFFDSSASQGWGPSNQLVIGMDTMNPLRYFGGYMRELRITRGTGFIAVPPAAPTAPWSDP